MRIRTRCVAAAAMAAVLLTAAACGDGSGSGSGSGSTGKQLLIINNTIVSGPNAGSFAITQGFDAYLKYINDQGGVNGYTFKWEDKDNAYSPAQSATVQNQALAANPFAISVIGTVPAQSAAQVSSSSQSKIPLMVAADGALVDQLAPTLPGGIYGFVPNYANLAQYDAQFVMDKLGDKNFALAWENDSLAQGAQASISKYVPANGGSLAASVAIPPTTTNFVPLVTQLKSSGAKTVVAWVNGGLVASLQKAAAQIGFKPTWVTPFFALSAGYLKLAGPAAEGTYIDGLVPPPSDTSTEAGKLFNQQVAAYAPTAVSGAGQQGWMLAAVMVQGIRDATAGGKELTQPNFIAAVAKINGTVALGPLNYTGRHWGATQASMYQVKNNQFVQVQPLSALPGVG
jgi:branched-chain amino acid transport system substrate-binding protein